MKHEREDMRMEHNSKRRLNTYVHVRRDNHEGGSGEYVAFGPGDRVPDWAAEKITAPGMWQDEDDEDPPAPAPSWLDGHSFAAGAMVSTPAVTPPGRDDNQEDPRMSTTAYRKITAAAAAGDPDARRALEALNDAASAIPEGTRSSGDDGAEQGIAEARRRYGPLPGNAA